MATKNVDVNESIRGKDSLALIVSLLFIFVIGFLGYRYFMSPNTDTTPLDGITADIKNLMNDEENFNVEDNISSASDIRIREVLGDSENSNSETTWNVENAGTWTALDHTQGDVDKGTNYKVVQGDTLWEIAEGAYGNGADWVRILEANQDIIGMLPSGQQALIVPGQTLVIPG